MRAAVWCIGAATIVACARRAPNESVFPSRDPRATLLAADSALGRAAADTDLVTAISAAFANDVILLGGGRVARGIDSARALLRGNPDNPRSVIHWAPIGGGVSGDGRHGYTYGYARWRKPDSSEVQAKYVAYWARRDESWRILVYKRAGRAIGAPTRDPRPVLARRPTVTIDSISAAASLRDAELAFAREAGVMGLAEAFRRNAAPDAAHIGAPTDSGFRLGPDDIAAGLRGNEGPLGGITWAPDEVHVAASGDLGVTIGRIRIATRDSAAPPPPPTPFFTIWKRVAPSGEWKFVVE